MTRPKDSSPQRLPQQIELQTIRDELTEQIQQLEVKFPKYGVVYFVDGEEMFGLTFNKNTISDIRQEEVQWEISVSPCENTEGTIYGSFTNEAGGQVESRTPYKNRTRYYPPIDFVVAGLGKFGNLYGMNTEPINLAEEVGNIAELVRFMNETGENDFKNPIQGIILPQALIGLIERIREAPRMKLEYLKPEFYKLYSRVNGKAIKTDYSKYEPGRDNIAATTGWVKVEKDRQEVELKFDIVGQINNGSYDELGEVYKRNLGDNGDGQHLFGETGLWFMGSINNLEKLQECIDILKLLDAALPDPDVSSS